MEAYFSERIESIKKLAKLSHQTTKYIICSYNKTGLFINTSFWGHLFHEKFLDNQREWKNLHDWNMRTTFAAWYCVAQKVEAITS